MVCIGWDGMDDAWMDEWMHVFCLMKYNHYVMTIHYNTFVKNFCRTCLGDRITLTKRKDNHCSCGTSYISFGHEHVGQTPAECPLDSTNKYNKGNKLHHR